MGRSLELSSADRLGAMWGVFPLTDCHPRMSAIVAMGIAPQYERGCGMSPPHFYNYIERGT